MTSTPCNKYTTTRNMSKTLEKRHFFLIDCDWVPVVSRLYQRYPSCTPGTPAGPILSSNLDHRPSMRNAPLRTIPACLFTILLLAMSSLSSVDVARGQESLSFMSGSERTVGLLSSNPDAAWEGYTLFYPIATKTFVLDMDGQVLHTWDVGYNPGLSAYLLPDGTLLRPANIANETFDAGGRGGLVHILAPDGSSEWSFTYSDDTVSLHHDVEYLPNGNILMLAWELKSGEEALANGRDPDRMPDGLVWSDTVIEVRPTGPTTGEIIWKWDAFDHLVQDFDQTKENFGVISEHPGRIDIHAGDMHDDWLHLNAIDYNAELDQIVLSSRTLSEIFIIDHSTTTEEAAGSTGGRYGKGGDLLYRYGNPANYGRGDTSDRRLWVQHDPQWIPDGHPGAGNMTVFNNGQFRSGGDRSSVDEITLPQTAPGVYVLEEGEPYGPSEPTWTFEKEGFYAAFISGAQRLPNGNTLITEGTWGNVFEVTEAGEQVWRYKNPIYNNEAVAANAELPDSTGLNTANLVFRSTRYPTDYPGFAPLNLAPQGYVEGDFIDTAVEPDVIPGVLALESLYPNPARDRITASLTLDSPGSVAIQVVDGLGRVVSDSAPSLQAAGPVSIPVSLTSLTPGMYLVRVSIDGRHVSRPVVVL